MRSPCSPKRNLEKGHGPLRRMAKGTKREGAQRVLDAHRSRANLNRRLTIGVVAATGLSGGILWLTRWEFALAAGLVFGLLLQFAHERMTTILDAHFLTGLRTLGWDEQTELDEKKLATLVDLAGQ